MTNIETINSLKQSMPKSIAAIGYGSGIFKQTGYQENEKPDKDVILVVDDFKQFLIEDYEINPEHFSKDFNKNILYKRNEKTNFYNNLGCLKLNHNGIHFKVMVVSKSALEYDLKTWKYFGMAGRLSKPILYEDMPANLEKAIIKNRENMLITSLLLNSEDKLNKIKLYETISKITYLYDFRTIFHAEKKTKSSDIVGGSLQFFENEYGENPIARINDDIVYNTHPIELIDSLPSNLKNTIYSEFNKKPVMTYEELSQVIENYFKKTNFTNSIRFALSSGAILGVKGSAQHVLQKFKKANR